MDVELLVVADCPSEEPTAVLLRDLLRRLRSAPVTLRVRVITSQREADQYRFIGSPTVLIDGVDPFARPDQRPALACRLYRTPHGTSNRPDPELLWSALSRAYEMRRTLPLLDSA